MDFYDEHENNSHVGDHYAFSRASGHSRNFNDDPRRHKPNGHEQYHALHVEAAEAVSDSEEDEPSYRRSANRTTRSSSDAGLDQMIMGMKQRILRLEMQLKSSPNVGTQPRSIDLSVANPASEIKIMDPSVEEDLTQTKMMPQLCEKSWFEFMNKNVSDEYEYAIEVLREEPNYQQATTYTEEMLQGKPAVGPPGVIVDPKSPVVDDTIMVPDRIRINSPWILQILAGIDRYIDPTVPLVMLRPYKFLVNFEDKIMESIRQLEAQINSFGSTMPSGNHSNAWNPTETGQESELSRDSEHRQLSLEHLLCLTEFIRRYLRPTLNRLQNIDSKIRFRDLWYIFRPGVHVYMPLRLSRERISPELTETAMKSTPEALEERFHFNWRVIGAGGGRRNAPSTSNRNTVAKLNPFQVNCYYIDFDGRYFCPITHTFNIMPFKGERDIRSLEFFPVRYIHDFETIQRRGALEKMIFNRRESNYSHFYYSGYSVTKQPCGCDLQKEFAYQEYVESEVIVDFNMAFAEHPEWRPKPALWKDPPVEKREVQEKYPVRYWKRGERPQLENTSRDHIYDDHFVDWESAMRYKSNEPIYKPISSTTISNENMVPDKDILLLSSRVFAFVLRTRTFLPLSGWLLQPIRPQINSLRSLELRDDNNFKDTLQALVKTHFQQKTSQEESNHEFDLVRGKGKGLVILLHGAPGVGKTFTAESVAAANGKPLFQISCGDLGLTPSEVEGVLRKVFRFAQLWNCVLLLDECDIFLTRRTKNDLKRNSLVSVFLRVLEFYTGVIFLTTNRVGVLDDAIKSRITWSAYYPPLDEKQTGKIWKANLTLLEERKKNLRIDRAGILAFAKEHFKSRIENESPWNGRQIQNAFKVAVSLAEWDAINNSMGDNMNIRFNRQESSRSSQPILRPKHFEAIVTGTDTFDDYLREATGVNDAERAFQATERADDYTMPVHNSFAHSDGYFQPAPGEYNRNQQSIAFSSSPNMRQQNPSPFASAVSPRTQGFGHEGSSQSTHRRSNPSPGGQMMNMSHLHPPHTHSRKRSTGQQTAVPVSTQLRPQAQTSPLEGGSARSSYVAISDSYNITTATRNRSSRTRKASNQNLHSRKDSDDAKIGSESESSEDEAEYQEMDEPIMKAEHGYQVESDDDPIW